MARGTEVKTMGDPFRASFGSVTKAVECAVALHRSMELGTGNMGEPLRGSRCGLETPGEPIEEDGDLFGATVILASRIAATKADGGGDTGGGHRGAVCPREGVPVLGPKAVVHVAQGVRGAGPGVRG